MPCPDPSPPRPPPSAATCWHDGALRPVAEATLPADAMSVRFGLGVFEGIRLYRQASGGVLPLALGPHLERLAHSAADAGLPTAVLGELPEALAAVVGAHAPSGDAYLRINLTIANAGVLASPARGCLTVGLVPLPGRRANARPPLRLQVSPCRRVSPRAMPSHIKATGNYAAAYRALVQARAAGFDSCILRADDDSLCEAPTAALFVVHHGQVLTPPLSSGCLPSITRDTLLGLCRALGVPAAERPLDGAALATAEEVFLAGTAMEIRSVGAVDARPLPAERPITDRLDAAYAALCRGERAPLGGEGPSPLPWPAFR